MPSDRSGREKRDILKEASDAAFGYNSLIKQVRTGFADSVQEVLIANSEGVWAEDRRVRTRFTTEAKAKRQTKPGRFGRNGTV